MEDSDHQSGAFIGSNEDLLTEILICLPVTSILRFKSVSKHWRSLLRHTHFTHRYDSNINNLSKSPLGLFGDNDVYVPFDVENRSPPPFRSLDFYFNRSHVRIEQSCNGLLLCVAPSPYYGSHDYYVFNPTTKQLKIIPSLPKYVRSVALAFHPTKCVHYKVVCVTSLESRKGMFQIQVYSSDTRTWKICVESFSAAERSKYYYPVYCNGAVCWVSDNYHSGSNFVCFKLDSEQLQMLPLMSYGRSIMYFGESRGHLHLILNTRDEKYMLHVKVYERRTDHSGWFVKYQVQLDEFLTTLPTMARQYSYKYDVVKVVDVVRGKEEEDTFLVLATSRRMIRYNVHDKSYKELYDGGDCNLHLSCFHRYIGALSSF